MSLDNFGFNRIWSCRQEEHLIVMDMCDGREMVREIKHISVALSDWIFNDVSPEEVIIKMQELNERYQNFWWFLKFPELFYYYHSNLVSVSGEYFRKHVHEVNSCVILINVFVMRN